MLVLDTDHLTVYQQGSSPEARRMIDRLDQTTEQYGTTIITIEEIMRGWMAAVRRVRNPHRQIVSYMRLQRLFRFFATWQVLEWNEPAADAFQSLRQAKTRIGTMDLKIASICLANNATLLSRNLRDFEQVPGLVVEDWLA